jgi:hypothetical protein
MHHNIQLAEGIMAHLEAQRVEDAAQEGLGEEAEERQLEGEVEDLVAEELPIVSEQTSDNINLNNRQMIRMTTIKLALIQHRRHGFAGSYRWLSMTRRIWLKATQMKRMVIGLFDDNGIRMASRS